MRACLSATLASAATAFLMIASPSTASALSIGMNLQGDNNNPNYRYNRVELSGNASANQGGPAYTYSHSTRDGEDLHSYDLLYNIDVSGLSLSLNGDVQDISQFNGYLHFHYTVGKAARYSPFSGSFSNYFNQEYAYYQFGLASKTKGENGRYFDVTAAGSKVELGDPAFQSLRNFEVNQNNADEFFIMNLVDLINQANPDQYSILESVGETPHSREISYGLGMFYSSDIIASDFALNGGEISSSVAAVPLPATAFLLPVAIGALGFAGKRRRRQA